MVHLPFDCLELLDEHCVKSVEVLAQHAQPLTLVLDIIFLLLLKLLLKLVVSLIGSWDLNDLF